MALHLVPLPLDSVADAVGIWAPFIERIAKRDDRPVEELLAEVCSGNVHLILAWDSEEKKAHAVMGVRFVDAGKEHIAEVVWLTGQGREQWTPLLDDLEIYLREHQACTRSRMICRPGWLESLKSSGYKTTHYVMEKGL